MIRLTGLDGLPARLRKIPAKVTAVAVLDRETSLLNDFLILDFAGDSAVLLGFLDTSSPYQVMAHFALWVT